ncbi:MAG: hypothetical protein OEW35_07470 [Gammaproteobacteria bacterium]|nr:hypothetical protein [Gammaproteobacteria bacterium]MDH5309034.1 hypothetical protein [Gammaproteobacteria bacterium]
MIRIACMLIPGALAAGCATPEPVVVNSGIAWVRTAAEFDALSLQAYRAASDALESKIADPSWSALPYQADAAGKPPAVIFDVDETVISNVEFQLTLEPPFEDRKLDAWTAANPAEPIAGFPAFARRARELGVELFFVTNRPCEAQEDNPDPCPQKANVVNEIVEAGVPVEPGFVMLSHERPEWSKEKKIRRDLIAENYRVIMLIGDDLGDFLPCSRRRPLAPCTEGATAGSRRDATFEHADYWGNGWYVLPNPMHGSWTTVD